MDLAANARLYPSILHARSQVVVYGTGAAEAPIPAQFMLVNAITLKWIFVYELTAQERAAAVSAINRMMEDKWLIHNVAKNFPLVQIAACSDIEGSMPT